MGATVIAVGKIVAGHAQPMRVALWADAAVEAAMLKGGRLYRAGDPRGDCLNEYERQGYDQAADHADYVGALDDVEFFRRGC